MRAGPARPSSKPQATVPNRTHTNQIPNPILNPTRQSYDEQTNARRTPGTTLPPQCWPTRPNFGSAGVATAPRGTTVCPPTSPEVHATSQGDIFLSARLDKPAAQLPGKASARTLSTPSQLPVAGVFVFAGCRSTNPPPLASSIEPSGHRGHAAFTDFAHDSDLSLDFDAQGRIYVTGEPVLEDINGQSTAFTLLRLNPDGSLDQTLANRGRIVTSQTLYNPTARENPARSKSCSASRPACPAMTHSDSMPTAPAVILNRR